MTRWFPDDCDIVGHDPGDRHWSIGACDQEWTGTEWTRVCPKCDEAMTGRWEAGWLCCRWCRMLATDVPRREVAP